MIQKLGKYRIVEKLGGGAMGNVYKAYDDVLDRNVAIKIMAEDIKWNPELKLRFFREARAAASLHHPNIVTIFHLGEERKITFIVMEFLQGKDLKHIIQERASIPLEQKLSIMAQVADGLSHAHLGGFIHRDIKPGNIFLTASGTVKILDFGIAHIPASDLTRTGERLGTPIYMSPEQIRDEKYDARADIFSAGIVFYELLTYVHPFRDKKLEKTLDNILGQNQFFFAEQFPEAPTGLWPILNTCLAKEPSERYASMAEAGRACRRLMDELNLASQQMTKDLEAALPGLRQASKGPHAPAKLVRFWQETQDLLNRDQKPDYLSLLRLTAELSRDPLLQANAGSLPSPIQHKDERPLPRGSTGPEGVQGAGLAAAEDVPVDAPRTIAASKSARQEAASSAPLADQPGRDVEAQLPASIKTQPPIAPAAETPIDGELQGRQILADAEVLLAEERLDEALDCLRTTMGLLGPIEPLVQMLAETRRKIEERNRARVSQFLDAAREAVAARQFPKAVEVLDEVLGLEPDRPDAIEMRRLALGEIESERLRQARKEEGEREKTAGFRLLAERKFRESLRVLRRAAELLGEDSTIRLGIDEAEEGFRAEELRARVLSELAEAQQLFRSRVLDKARMRANRVLEISPKNAEAIDLLARIDKAQEEKNRRDAISSLLSQSQEALSRKDFGEALSLANEALQRDSSNAQILNLLERISEAKEETRRQEEVAELFAKVEESLGRQDFNEAEAQARSALAVFPEHPNALEYLKKIDQAREEQRRAQEIDNAFAEAKQAFQRGDLAQSESQARRALAIDPQDSRAKELLNRVVQAREKKRTDQITTLLTQGREALTKGDFRRSENCASEILQLEAQNASAQKLLADIKQAEVERSKAEIANLLFRSREALDQEKCEDAADLANEILARDAKHKEAKSLVKEIEKRSRAKEKELRKRQKELERASNAPSPGDALDEAAVLDRTLVLKASGRGRIRWILTRVGVGLIGIVMLAGGIYWIIHNSGDNEKTIDLSTTLNDAKSHLDRKMYDRAIEIAQSVLAASPSNSQAQAILAEAQKQKRQSAIEILMLEAQNLRAQNQLEESLKIIGKVIDIDSGYQPALAVRSQIEADISAGKTQDEEVQKRLTNARSLLAACKLEEAKAEIDEIRGEQDKEIQKRLASARSLLPACKLEEAKVEIEKATRTSPDAPELSSLRRQLAAKTAQLARIQEDLAKWSKVEQTQTRIAELSKKAEQLFRQAKYSECQGILDQWLAEAPQSSQAQSLRGQANEALAGLRNYQTALAAKRYDDALHAVDRLEKINSSDPDIAELRQRVVSLQASAKAILTVYRLSEPGSLTLDDQPIGANGEVANKVVSIGPHKLAVKNSTGRQNTLSLEFVDGQNSTYVYNSTTLELRLMTAADRKTISDLKQREEVHRFSVEHPHGFARGSCSGELLIGGFRIEYKPSQGSHHFTARLANLKLNLNGEKLEFTEIPGNKPFQNFKARDLEEAKSIKELWDRIEKLGK